MHATAYAARGYGKFYSKIHLATWQPLLTTRNQVRHVLHLNEGISNTYDRLGIVARFGKCMPLMARAWRPNPTPLLNLFTRHDQQAPSQ